MTTDTKAIEEKLDTMVALLQHLLAIELSKSGMKHEEIRKHLGVGKATVNGMLIGIKKQK